MIDQTTLESRVSDSVSTLSVASVAHPEGNPLSSPNVVAQGNLVYTKPENASVSY